MVITIVALLFSLLLFTILICWVVLTSTYVLSFDKSCDVPLKPYFWLATFQLVLDVFRTDIMRYVFNWDSGSNQRIPLRVILYNMAYLLYALLVLRLGISSVFLDNDTTCNETAPELYNTTTAFVSLSLAAWGTIFFGYLLPFCVVAGMLTCNGYNPSEGVMGEGNAAATQPVFPAAYSMTGAPADCVDRLPVVIVNEEFLTREETECCICMDNFHLQDIAVETACQHYFHKSCCREWLRHARTCPVCRTDIPSNMACHDDESDSATSAAGPRLRTNSSGGGGSVGGAGGPPTNRIPIGPTGRPVVGLIRLLQQTESGGVGVGGGAIHTSSSSSMQGDIASDHNSPRPDSSSVSSRSDRSRSRTLSRDLEDARP